ncbi:hypothetical protein ACK3TF_005966 [Chlorella vulgaris]
MGHGGSKQEGEAANQETQEANPTEPAAAALAEPERPSEQRQIEDLLEGITRRLPLAAAPACPPRPVAAKTAAASNSDSPTVGRSASPPPRWLPYSDIDAAACHLFGRVEKSGGHAVPLPAGHLSACCRIPDSLVPHHSFTMYGQPFLVPQVLNYPQPGGEEHEFLCSEKVRFAEIHELLEQLIDGVFLTEGAGSGDKHAPRCSFRLCYDPSTPQRPDQQEEEEAQQEEEQDTDASSSGCDEGTTDVDSITSDGAGMATDYGGDSAAASSSAGGGAGFAATDNSAGQAAIGTVPADDVANCEVESKASDDDDDDDEGWETGGQGGGLLSNAAMEAAAVRLFGCGGGSTQSLVPASMPAAAHSLHLRLHLLIAEVFLADSHVSPHVQLVWDAEDDALGYVSAAGVACFNAAADVGEPAHSSDAPARREHQASRSRPWFLAACRLLSQCLTGSHQDLSLEAEVHAQVVLRYTPRFSQVAEHISDGLDARRAARERERRAQGAYRRSAALPPCRPAAPALAGTREEEEEDEFEEEIDASSSGCDEGTTNVNSITGDGAGVAADDGGGSAAASSSTGGGAGFAATDNSAGQAAIGTVPADDVANCEVESKASDDDDDEGWETGGQGGGLLSNAAMEAAAVRLFGRGGGSTQSLDSASMPAAAHSLHSRLHLLIAEVFLADLHVSPHVQLAWDAEDAALGYVSAAGVACFNAAADVGEPAHSSDAPARREHQASRSRLWFLAACRLLSQCLTGSHQDLSLAAEVHAQVVLRYTPRFSQVASLA